MPPLLSVRGRLQPELSVRPPWVSQPDSAACSLLAQLPGPLSQSERFCSQHLSRSESSFCAPPHPPPQFSGSLRGGKVSASLQTGEILSMEVRPGGGLWRRPLEGPRSGGGVPQQGGEPGAPQALLYQRLPGSSCPWTPGFSRAHTSSHLSPKSRENVSNCMTHGPNLCWLTGRGSPGHWWGDRGRGSTGFRQPEAESLALAASHTPSSASFMPGRPDQA